MISSVKTTLLAVTMVVTACSARSLGLRYADKVALHELDRWFDLTNDQEDTYAPLVKAEVERLKKERLPLVVQKLEAYAKAWERGPTEADAAALLDEYDSLRLHLADSLGPLAARFLKGLEPDQIEHLQEELADSNEKMQDLAALPPGEFEKKQSKSTLKGFEYWLGDLSDDQEARFLALVPPDREDFERRRAERLASQKAFVELVATATSEAEIAAKIAEWTKEPHKMRGASPAEGARRRARMLRVLASTHALATEKQRRHAQREIADLIADLKAAAR